MTLGEWIALPFVLLAGLFALCIAFGLTAFLGWLVALGLLAYGMPVEAFWMFVAWIVALSIYIGLCT